MMIMIARPLMVLSLCFCAGLVANRAVAKDPLAREMGDMLDGAAEMSPEVRPNVTPEQVARTWDWAKADSARYRIDSRRGEWAFVSDEISSAMSSRLFHRADLSVSLVEDCTVLQVENLNRKYPVYFGLGGAGNQSAGPREKVQVPLGIYRAKSDRRCPQVQVTVMYWKER